MSSYSQEQIDQYALDLPDFIHGKLDANYMAEIEAAIAVTPELRAEYDELLAFVGEVRAERQPTDFAAFEADASRFSALQDKIKAAPKPASRAVDAPSLTERMSALFYGGNIWKPAFAVACGLLVVQFVSGGDRSSQDYQALSGDEAVTGAPVLYLVQFQDDAKFAEINDLLAGLGLTISKGPSEGLVALSAATNDGEIDVNAVLARLQESDIVEIVLKQGSDL